jgi:hypothetical protein
MINHLHLIVDVCEKCEVLVIYNPVIVVRYANIFEFDQLGNIRKSDFIQADLTDPGG